MAELKITSLKKQYYSGAIALENFDLTVNDGESMAVYGLDASGKSTLIRLIAGLDEVTEGNILLNGKDITAMPAKERNIAYISRDAALDNRVSVYDNLAYGLRARKIPEPVIEVKVKAVADLLNLGDLLLRKPKSLTTLQRRRVVLGRAVARDPEIYLFDDPVGGMDADLRDNLLKDLVALQLRLKATFVYATDDIAQAVTLADKIAVLEQHTIAQVGTAEELYLHPADEFIADVMGSMKPVTEEVSE